MIAYLQSLGGEVTVTLESTVWPLGGREAASGAGESADQEG